MKNVKKLLALMLAMVMCMGMFAGCVQEDENKGSAPSLSIPSVNDDIADMTNAERYPLQSTKTYKIANRAANPNDRDTYKLWNEITGVDVNWVEMSGDQLSQVMAGGDMPDAICISWGVDKEIIAEYGEAGKLVNFAEYLEYMPNFQKMMEKYPMCLTNYMNNDGSFYSLPAQSGSVGSPGNLLYVRNDMLEDSGLTLPKTIDEFKQFILDLQEHYSDVEDFSAVNFLMGGEYGYIEWNGYMDNYFFPSFGTDALQTGFDLVDGKVVLGCTTEQYKRYLEFISWVYASGACEQDIFSTDATNVNKAKVASNLAVMFPASSVGVGNFDDGIIDMDILGPLTSQWQSEKVWTNTTTPGWSLNCVNAKLPEEDIITLVQWFDAFYADDTDPLNEAGTITGMFLYKGEEGVHFKRNENGTYERIYKGNYNTAQEWANNECSDANLYASWCTDISYGNTAFYCKQVGVRENLWPHMVERWNTNSLFLTEDESFDAADINTELNIYMESTFAKFMTGEWTVEANWDQYIKDLESIGALDLVDIYQAAYDRYQ